MAADTQAIRSAIIAKLQGVGSLNGVYRAEEGSPTDGAYPFATVVIMGVDAKVGSIVTNIRTHKFQINIYQERTSTGFGNVKAEDVISLICDEIETAFDMDITLSGICKWVKPLKFNANYVDREMGDTRVAQFTVEAVTVADAKV